MERAGQGMNRIFETALRESKGNPDFTHTDLDNFWITLNGKIRNDEFLRFLESIGDDRVETLSADELIVLTNVFNSLPVNEKLNTVAAKLEKEGLLAKMPKSRGRRWRLATAPATKKEIVLDYCTIPRSRTEIQEHIGITHKQHFLLNILRPLLDAGLLVQTIPDKPNSPKQKYVTQRE